MRWGMGGGERGMGEVQLPAPQGRAYTALSLWEGAKEKGFQLPLTQLRTAAAAAAHPRSLRSWYVLAVGQPPPSPGKLNMPRRCCCCCCPWFTCC